MFKELWKYRLYIFNNAFQELKYRYAGSTMGIFWNVLNPVFQIIVYSMVFSQIMRAKLPDVLLKESFTIYLCSGILAWFSFSECILRGTNSLIENSTFLKKLPIPEQVFVAQAALSSGLNLGISYSIFAIYVIITNYRLTIYWSAVPVVLLLFVLFAFGIAMLLSSINVFFRDTYQIMSIVIMVWMWLTPIVYVKDILPSSILGFLDFNPAYYYIRSLHQLVVYNLWPTINQWGLMAALALLSMLFGFFVMSKLRREIRDTL